MQGPTRFPSMIGNGGPLCAATGVADTPNTTAATRHLDQVLFIRALSHEERSAHIHRLEDQPQRRAPYQYADRSPGGESTMQVSGRVLFSQAVSQDQRSGEAQHEET